MRLVKRVIEIGNGAAVYVPKEYKGKEVVVLLPEGIKEVKREVFSKLLEFMPNIMGVYLYGSYARSEETKDSDVDLLVIVQEKDDNLKNALKDFDARIITFKGVINSIENYPVLIIPILRESKALMNSGLLEELKSKKIDFRKFGWSFDEIRKITKIIESFVKLDDKEIAPSHVSSLIMRLRVCYLIECLLKDKVSTNKGFGDKLSSYGLSKKEIDKFIDIYRIVRDGFEYGSKVNKEEVFKLLDITNNYLREIENETKKKIRKRN